MTEDELHVIISLRKELASKDEVIEAKDEDIKAKDDLIADGKQQLAARNMWNRLTKKVVASASDVWQQWQRQWQQICDEHDEYRRRRRDAVIRKAGKDVKAKDDLIADLKQRLAVPNLWNSLTKKVVASVQQWQRQWQGMWVEHPSYYHEGHRYMNGVANMRNRHELYYEYTTLPHFANTASVVNITFVEQKLIEMFELDDWLPSCAKLFTIRLPSILPPTALVTHDVFFRYLSFLDLKDFATVARTCRTWREGTQSVGNTYWRAIAHCRWPEWATAIDAEVGRRHSFKSACKQMLCSQHDRMVELWRKQALPSILSAEYDMYCGNPKGVPRISWLSHQGHITGSRTTLSALSQEFGIVAPIFKRYERAALAMYDDRRGYCWTFGHLPPVPSNITDKRRTDHEKARSAVKAIYFRSDGRLLDKKPSFSYDSDAALYYATDFELLSPAQVLAGITHLRSLQESA